jgi:hypothetical protein
VTTSYYTEMLARWPGVRRRLLRQSSLCRAAADEHGKWLIADTELADAELAAMVAAHESGTAMLKSDRKRQISRGKSAGDARSHIIKEYRTPGPYGRWRPDVRAWVGTAKVSMVYGFRVARGQAFLRLADGRGMIVFEDAGATTVEDLWCALNDDQEPGALFAAVAELVARLHDAGVGHGDLSPANIVHAARQQTASDTMLDFRDLCLIDCDDVTCHRGPTPAKTCVRNLYQLVEGIRRCCPTRDRRRTFLNCYQQYRRLNDAQFAPWRDDVLTRTE